MNNPSNDPIETVLADLFDEETNVTPRAAFAEQLRSRLETELGVTSQQINFGSLFYFVIPGPDIERTASFYSNLFGWELHQGDSGYHVANVYPPMGLMAGEAKDPQVWIEVDDIEAAVEKVRALGGTADTPAHYDSGWSSSCVDPQGVRFHLQVPRAEYRQEARRSTEHGELFYWTLPAPDATESKTFYNELFGWEFGDPGSGGGMHIDNQVPDGGLGGGREGTHPDLFFRVADLDQTMAAVAELGGTSEFVGEGPEGRHAMCQDDQGVTFGISQPNEGY